MAPSSTTTKSLPVAMHRIKLVKAPMSEMMTQLQRAKPAKVSTTDVHLMCADGFVPAHSSVLRLASTFFKDLFFQYSKHAIRSRVIPVILPDYNVRVVRKVIQMMYCGFAENITSEKELNAVKELLELFEMDGDPSIILDQTEVNEDYLPLLFYERNLLAENRPEEDSDYEEEIFEIEQEVVYENQPTIEPTKQEQGENQDSDDSGSPVKNDSVVDEEEDEELTDLEVLPKLPTSTPIRVSEVVDLADESDQDQETDREAEGAEMNGSRESEEADGSKSKSPMKRRILRKPRGTGNGKTKSSSPTTPIKRSLRPRRSDPPKKKVSSDSSESDKYKESASSSDFDSEEEITRKYGSGSRRRRTAAVGAKPRQAPTTKVMLPSARPASANVKVITRAGGPHKPTQKVDKPGTSASVKSDDKETEVVFSEEYISSMNDDDDDSDYANSKHAKFMEASRRCHKCGKTYESAKEASMCVTEKHKMVRCYYCFKVLPNTEGLFEHYKDNHKKAGKEGHLLCKFCHQAVSFKSVSTHVISNHLFDRNKKPGPGVPSTPNTSFNRGRPGRPPTIANTSPVSPATPSVANKRRVAAAGSSSEFDSSDDDDDVALMGAGKLVIKKTTATGKKIKTHR